MKMHIHDIVSLRHVDIELDVLSTTVTVFTDSCIRVIHAKSPVHDNWNYLTGEFERLYKKDNKIHCFGGVKVDFDLYHSNNLIINDDGTVVFSLFERNPLSLKRHSFIKVSTAEEYFHYVSARNAKCQEVLDAIERRSLTVNDIRSLMRYPPFEGNQKWWGETVHPFKDDENYSRWKSYADVNLTNHL